MLISGCTVCGISAGLLASVAHHVLVDQLTSSTLVTRRMAGLGWTGTKISTVPTV